MKRSHFFKSIMALPLISHFFKSKANPVRLEEMTSDHEPIRDCPADYVPFYPFKKEDCDHLMWFFDKHNPDPKKRVINCMNCGWRPNAYELFRTINDQKP